MTPTLPDLRRYLTTAYSDEELVTLCADYFRDVYENFAAGMTKAGKIQLLLDHCQHRELLPSLFAALERDRPAQYRQRFAAPAATPRPAVPLPGHDPRHVFVSHAQEDADFAHRLAADLQANGWRVWIAPDSIQPGEKWAEAINRGLEECGIFVVALTPAAVASDWVKTETNLAIELAHRHEVRFIPLGVTDCRLPVLWTAFQRISFAGRYAEGLTALLMALDGGQAKPPAPPAVLTFDQPIYLELIRIPAGEFLMGSDPVVDKDASADEQPQHRVYLPDFYIGKVPVTNAQFEVFIKATSRRTQAEQSGYGWVLAGRTWGQVKGADWRHPHGPETDIAQKVDHPVVQVSWDDAVAFCRWLRETTGQAFRLPTEAEWEKAARGTHARIYPWGDEPPDKSRCNFNRNIGDTTPVGQYPQGATPDYGVLDMAGNVWESCSDWYDEKAYQGRPDHGIENPTGPVSGILRVLRGGAWSSSQKRMRCAYRDMYNPDRRYANYGFRVVRSSLP